MLILDYKMLPQKFNSAYDPKKTEKKIYKLWTESGYFNPDKLPQRYKLKAKRYSVMMAPPNITGSLHMGHVLENTEVDILVRMKRMKGFKTLWLPGIDHAGISAQNVVEKELHKEGLRRQDLGREKFEKRVKEWKEKYGNIILEQLKMLGVSPDFSRTRYTLDSDYSEAVLEAFSHYYKKGWIYRGERVINWCVRCSTSISDLEVNYVPERAKLYFIKYGPLTLATTRPETKLGDTALAVHPNDKRYQNYIGKNLEIESINNDLPIVELAKTKKIKIKVVADKSVDPKFGTGIIKVTPAHDLTDFEIAKRHNLKLIAIIDERGRMNTNAGLRYQNMKIAEAREQIVKDLQNIGLIEKIEDYEHNVARCGRCNSIVEPLPSKQWFLKMEKLSKLALDALIKKETIIHPKKWREVLIDRLKNERDWNISRQLWWGHRIPVWLHEPKCLPKEGHESEIVKCQEYIVSLKEPKCDFCNAKFVQSSDVLDTWFSSALWPFATLGWPASAKASAGKPQKTNDLKIFYPTDFITSARDILNIWIAKMIFSGKEFMGKSPFKIAYIHSTILNKEGKRMSKSLGTGIDPLGLIEKYGSDAVRFGTIYQNLGSQDIRFNEDATLTGKKFCNKIWNASRFVLQQIEISNLQFSIFNKISNIKPKTNADKKILKDLEKIVKEIGSKIEKYEFGKALHKLYNFFWHDFCDIYIEKSKIQINNDKLSEDTKLILSKILMDSLKLLHPFMPFITEEIWSQFDKDLLLIQTWPKENA